MPSKRKHSSEDGPAPSKDEAHQVSRPKRTRREPVETHQKRQRITRSRLKPSTARPSSASSRPARNTSALAADLANLGDFNLPPTTYHKDRYSDSDSGHGRSPPTRRLRARKQVRPTRIEKSRSKKTITSSQKRRQRHRPRKELAELKRWAHWQSEAVSSSSDSDSDDEATPRSISRSFPAKQVGVQNVPWKQLPAEMRNMIYEYCIANEEEKVMNVTHYPQGIPRRSGRGASNTASFAHSYWGFTQTCQAIRAELIPWLLQKRNVRTPLATLNDYVNTFHRPGLVDGKRVGNVEPICTGAPLPGKGVEILELLKQKHESTEFRLQLIPTSVSPVLDALQAIPDPLAYDELKILNEIEAVFKKDAGEKFRKAGIGSIRILSIVNEAIGGDVEYDEDFEHGEQRSHDVQVELDIIPPTGAHTHRNKQISEINQFVFETRLAYKDGLQLHAYFAGGIARWKVRRQGVVDMGWKQKKRGGTDIYRRLAGRTNDPDSFDAEELD
ncbi:hypothetical protein HBH56_079460 [Parastagonospora nodorum]|uniref:Uncharacterized protein n=1 Tax=Phaeosphaeria nodorum (strain SN15 / ATCC MYA-4574 / FGSC 10173) TaxID=321614 RepID=A0A7U2F4F8_PHANO|nr:hypothetical protein HBH56_079460 [Parastagonospora nodorum]QRC96470.1 hypothetical protein JI435_013850 [Parastagonospora nodorum SN15]KAH3929790.1 hypothetical protein HBH54_122360 [Parastagonospora nodorum]KAH4058282.1 hypothetical protein HBH49_031080 [Parastagonospora nodorum]KAH4138208.1 hypothetical protein HBH45_116080 [Parastagonospora nodorum]